MIKPSTDGLLQYRIVRKGEQYFIQVLTEEKLWSWPWIKNKYDIVWRYAGKSGYPSVVKDRIFADSNPLLPPFESQSEAQEQIQVFWKQQYKEIINIQTENL